MKIRHGKILYNCTCKWGLGCKYGWCDIRKLADFLMCCSSVLPLPPRQGLTCSSLSVQCALLFISVGKSLLNLRWRFYFCSVVEKVLFFFFCLAEYIWVVAMKMYILRYWLQHMYFLREKKKIVLTNLFQKLLRHSYITWLTSSLSNLIICNGQHHFWSLGSEWNSALLFCLFVMYYFTRSQYYKLRFCMSYLSINAEPTGSL